MRALLLLAALISSSALAEPSSQPTSSPATGSEAQSPPANLPKSVAKLLSKADGRTQATAIKVRSVRQEYEVIGALGYQRGRQSLVMKDGKTYDVLAVTHTVTGVTREFWFDISSFYGFGF